MAYRCMANSILIESAETVRPYFSKVIQLTLFYGVLYIFFLTMLGSGELQGANIGNERVPKIIINNTINLFF